jgi:hypothetical protein
MSARCRKCRGLITEQARCQNGHEQPLSPGDALAAAIRDMSDQIGRLQAEVAELRKERPRAAAADEWVDVKEKARILGVSPDTVYGHADELGVERIGSGPKALLRFPRDCQPSDPERLRRPGREHTEPEIPKPRAQQIPAAGVPLLPVREGAA